MTILGTVNLRDWDTGCMLTVGGEVFNYVVDGETRAIYTIDVPGVRSGLQHLDNKIPLYFDTPEDVYQEYFLPNITFRRNDLTVAFDRHPWYQWVARAPAKGATKIVLPGGQVGYDRYANQWRATQFDITYDCIIAARRQQESVLMLHYVLRHFIPPWFIFKIVDSLGDTREYDAGEMSISVTSELADIADRTVGWTISFTVRGEIDLHDDRVLPAMTEPIVTYEKYNPNSQES
jgi:hypothetical protein